MRRAALMNTDDEGGEDSDGGNNGGSYADSEAGREPDQDPFANIEALSDEEAKEELREAQQRRLLEASQVRRERLIGANTCSLQCATRMTSCAWHAKTSEQRSSILRLRPVVLQPGNPSCSHHKGIGHGAQPSLRDIAKTGGGGQDADAAGRPLARRAGAAAEGARAGPCHKPTCAAAGAPAPLCERPDQPPRQGLPFLSHFCH